MKNSKVKIPIFCELGGDCDYWMGIGKVSQEDMLIDYNELEDYEGKELTIMARLGTSMMKDGLLMNRKTMIL